VRAIAAKLYLPSLDEIMAERFLFSIVRIGRETPDGWTECRRIVIAVKRPNWRAASNSDSMRTFTAGTPMHQLDIASISACRSPKFCANHAHAQCVTRILAIKKVGAARED
jgi:hypothetical protein